MRVRSLRAFTVAILLLVSVSVQGQQGTSVDGRIVQLKNTIQQYEAGTPSSETQALYRKRVKELRIELINLLQQKKTTLKKLRQEIPPADTGYIQEIDGDVSELDRDIVVAEQSLKGDLAVAAPNPVITPTPVPLSVPVAPTPIVTPNPRPQVSTLTSATTEVTPDNIPLRDCFSVVNDPSKFSAYEQAICFIARDVSSRKSTDAQAGIVLAQDGNYLLPVLFGKYVKAESRASFILDAEEARTDKQVGSGPASAGTTTLVVKGGVPSVFGTAVENGAAVADVSGTTITFRFNPVGTLNLLSSKGYITGYRESENDPVLRFLRKTSIGLSFDANRGNTPGTFTGDARQISALSFRYEFINERDPRLKRYQKDWEQFVATEGVKFTNEFVASLKALEIEPPENNDPDNLEAFEARFKDKSLQDWLDETNKKLAAAGSSLQEVEKVIKAQLDVLPISKFSTETVNALTKFADGFEGYLNSKKKLLDKIAKGKVLTFEYTNSREVTLPDTSNFRFIASTGTGNRIDLTANASLTMFNKRPVGMNVKRVRDFQFAGQVDVPLGDVTGIGQSVLSFAGRYERLMENAVTTTGLMMPNTNGNIGVGQLKLTIPIKNSGFKIPLSVTFANRTELIKEREVRGNFGFTFDLDTLFARLNPFSQK